jgi:hypothetical protein
MPKETRWSETGERIDGYDTSEIAFFIKMEEAEELSIALSSLEAFKLGLYISQYQTYVRILLHLHNEDILGKLSLVDKNFLEECKNQELYFFGKIQTLEEIEHKVKERIESLYPYYETK